MKRLIYRVFGVCLHDWKPGRMLQVTERSGGCSVTQRHCSICDRYEVELEKSEAAS